MSRQPFLSPLGHAADKFSWLTQRFHLCGSLLINSALMLQISHVLRSPGYQPSADLHYVLAWAAAVNLLSTSVTLALQPGSGWSRAVHWIWLSDWTSSLLPLVLVRVLRIPALDHRLHVFGLVYAIFVFARLSMLVACVRLLRDRPGATIRLAVFFASFVVYFGITPWAAAAAWPTGDEPHYLLLTHSLLHDHDFDLRNNYEHKDYKVFYPPDVLDHHAFPTKRGEELPIHDVGISIALVPGYALENRLGATIELNLFGAVVAAGVFQLAVVLGATAASAISCWALFAFVSPLITYSSQVYPEVAGAALMIWAVIAFARFMRSRSSTALLIVGCLLAPVPWLSVRYWIVLGPFGIAMVLYLAAKLRPFSALLRGFVLLGLPMAVSLLVFSLLDQRLYGVFEPNAGYVLYVPTMVPSMFEARLHVGLLGLLFDRAFGLLPTAPIYLVAIAGLWPALRTRRVLALMLIAPIVSAILFAAVNHWWYGGWAPPTRYIYVVLALLAPFAGSVLASTKSKAVVAALATWSFLIAFGFTAFPLTRYTYWDVNSGALSKFVHEHEPIDFGLAFPSFIRAAGEDYALAAVWTGLAAGAILMLLKRSPQARTTELSELQSVWDQHAKADPLWAILSEPAKKGRKWNLEDFLATGVQDIAHVLEEIERAGVALNYGTAVDFGCGVGRLTQPLAARFEQAIGIDISPTMIDLAERINRHGKRARYILNGVNDLSVISDHSADLVFSHIVLQHIHPTYAERYIRDFFRIAKPGAVIVFQIPSHFCEEYLPPDYTEDPLPPEACTPDIRLREPIDCVNAGSKFTVRLLVRNRSRLEWKQALIHQLNVANHWRAKDGIRLLGRGDGRARLPGRVKPGEEVALDLEVSAPRKPGAYRLELDIVQEGVRWFQDVGAEPVQFEVNVLADPASSAVADAAVENQDLAAIADQQVEPPPYEMHGIPKQQILSLIDEYKAQLVRIEEHITEWYSYRYYIRRN